MCSKISSSLKHRVPIWLFVAVPPSESQEMVVGASCPLAPSLSADHLSPSILLLCPPACLSCRTPHSSLSGEQLNCPVLPLAPSPLQPCVVWGVGLLYPLAFFFCVYVHTCVCVCVCRWHALQEQLNHRDKAGFLDCPRTDGWWTWSGN